MSPSVEFISLLRVKRAGFLATMTPEERAVMEEHMIYVKGLFDKGKILFAGAATDGTVGIIVYRADSADEAQQLYDNDPAVRAGIGYPELHPFHVGYLPGCRISG
jgi:uncharacterized protein YciI